VIIRWRALRENADWQRGAKWAASIGWKACEVLPWLETRTTPIPGESEKVARQ
jgi:hypothetical protein